MYQTESALLLSCKQKFSEEVSTWVEAKYPDRTKYFDKCSRDIRYVIQALVYCLSDGDFAAMTHTSSMFFTKKKLQLQSTHVEFVAYDLLLNKIEDLFDKHGYTQATNHCAAALQVLKDNLTK